MSRLEARARSLLHAYPPEYRADRGEEILGTLLDASPPGRNWPAPRDVRSMVTAACGSGPPATGSTGSRNLRLALLLAAVLGLAANPWYRTLWWVNDARRSPASRARSWWTALAAWSCSGSPSTRGRPLPSRSSSKGSTAYRALASRCDLDGTPRA
jgi:hypothetical protein